MANSEIIALIFGRQLYNNNIYKKLKKRAKSSARPPGIVQSARCFHRDTQNVPDSYSVFCSLIFIDTSPYRILIHVYWPSFDLLSKMWHIPWHSALETFHFLDWILRTSPCFPHRGNHGPCVSYFRVVSAIWERNQFNLYVVVCKYKCNPLCNR